MDRPKKFPALNLFLCDIRQARDHNGKIVFQAIWFGSRAPIKHLQNHQCFQTEDCQAQVRKQNAHKSQKHFNLIDIWSSKWINLLKCIIQPKSINWAGLHWGLHWMLGNSTLFSIFQMSWQPRFQGCRKTVNSLKFALISINEPSSE